MKRMIVCSSVLVGIAWGVSAAVACPHAPKTAEKNKDTAVTVASASAKTPCSKPCAGKRAVTVADKAGTPCSKPCSKKCAKLAAAKEAGCPIAKKVEAVLASEPSMRYRIGDEVTGCSKSAAAMAEKTGQPIEFLVGEEAFKDKDEAIARLTALLEEEAAAMQTLQYVAGGKCGRCPVTARNIAKQTNTKVAYRVGGVDFEKKENAEKVVKLVKDALGDVQVTYKVDGKTFHCDKLAGAKCKETGKKMTYVINGEETECPKRAKLMQAQAKLRKIVETAAAASFSL